MPAGNAGGTSGRLRASKACQRCNQKRVKCDALVVGQPCTRCRRGGQEPCVLISSRRGQYPRERANKSTETARSTRAHSRAVSVLSHTTDTNHAATEPTPVLNEPDQAAVVRNEVFPGQQRSPGETSGDSNATKDSQPSYQEISWAAMFNHFLDTHQNNSHGDVIDKCSITYLGESFPLALVLEDLSQGGRQRLHHPGPPLDLSNSPQGIAERTSHPPHIQPEDVTFLSAKNAFEYPASDVLDSVIDVFLNTYWPLYPLVNRQEFAEQHKAKQLPWLLLHSVCFVAATFGPSSLIHQAGFTGRKEARLAYHRRAKALFDTGYESNKIVVLQSVIMLTFWGGGPNDYWNFYSWISTGVTIAETLGIHRSTSGANMAEKDRSLLKRLWWILVTRDASCSTLVGRPFRINMEHGDAEMLTLHDFEPDSQSPEFAAHPLRQTFGAYQIEVAKLSLILYQLDFARFIPGPKPVTMAQVYENLGTWRSGLPIEMDWDRDPGHQNMLASCLSILYHHHIMLAKLGTSGTVDFGDSDAIDSVRGQSEMAAQQISTLASTIVTKSQSLSTPHEIYQGVFLAGVVSYVQMRSSQSTLAQLGRMIVNSCQMVMHDVRDAWDPSPWVIALFDRLTTATNDLVRHGDGDQHALGLAGTPNFAAMNDFDPAIFAGSIGSPWPSNQMLSALFDLPHDHETF